MDQLTKIVKSRKRLGRGAGSGWGTTAGRGTKGQKSRTGGNIPAYFQGGSLPLWQRLPKKDGIKPKSTRPIIVNLDRINDFFKEGEVVSIKSLKEKKLIKFNKKNNKFRLKILASGKLTKKITIDPEIRLSKKAAKTFKF